MQDLLGAGFYHVLLGVMIAAILGSVGGLVGRFLQEPRGRHSAVEYL